MALAQLRTIRCDRNAGALDVDVVQRLEWVLGLGRVVPKNSEKGNTKPTPTGGFVCFGNKQCATWSPLTETNAAADSRYSGHDHQRYAG